MKFIKGYKLISQEELSKLEADAQGQVLPKEQ